MTFVVVREKNHPYALLKNKELSLKAKGLIMLYLCSDALNEDFKDEEVLEFCSDDIQEIKKAVNELEKLGLINK